MSSSINVSMMQPVVLQSDMIGEVYIDRMNSLITVLGVAMSSDSSPSDSTKCAYVDCLEMLRDMLPCVSARSVRDGSGGAASAEGTDRREPRTARPEA